MMMMTSQPYKMKINKLQQTPKMDIDPHTTLFTKLELGPWLLVQVKDVE